MEAVRRLMEGPPPAPSSLRPGLPAEWDALLGRLMALAAEHRPASARELLREIRRILPDGVSPVELDLSVPHPAGNPLAGLLVGREKEEQALWALVERLAEGNAPSVAVTVSGPPGSGRRTLIRRVLRDVRLALLSQTLPPFIVDERGLAALQADLSVPPAGQCRLGTSPPIPAGAHVALVDALEARAERLCLLLRLAAKKNCQKRSQADHRVVVCSSSCPPSKPCAASGPSIFSLGRCGPRTCARSPVARQGSSLRPRWLSKSLVPQPGWRLRPPCSCAVGCSKFAKAGPRISESTKMTLTSAVFLMRRSLA